MYYVYEWFIKSTGEIIYVGKGKNNRYKVTKHNRFFNDMIRRFDCDSRIVKEFDNEHDAFLFEYNRVNELKSAGQCVCNIYNGGFGGSDEWWTAGKREHYSKNNVMKSQMQRKRMSEKNPMKDKETALRVNSQKRRKVIINGKTYASVKEAMDAYGVCYDTIASWCKRGINKNRELCRFADTEQVIYAGKRYNKGGCRALFYKNNHYETPKDLAEELNIYVDKIYRWAKKGQDKDGNICLYEDDERYKLIYDNQQPSRVNVDNSNSEGSTTNR